MDAASTASEYPWYHLLRDDRITSINIQSGTHIGKQAFYNCDAVKTITVNVSGNINSQAFYNCENATTYC